MQSPTSTSNLMNKDNSDISTFGTNSSFSESDSDNFSYDALTEESESQCGFDGLDDDTVDEVHVENPTPDDLTTKWHTLSSLLPLFQLLPGLKQHSNAHVLSGPTAHADIATFHTYSKLVKVLSLTDPHSISEPKPPAPISSALPQVPESSPQWRLRMLEQSFTHTPNPTPLAPASLTRILPLLPNSCLFPSLYRLTIDEFAWAHSELPYAYPSFLVPTLREIELEGCSEMAEEVLVPMLEMLPCAVPALTKLVLRGKGEYKIPSEVLLGVVTGLKGLQHLELDNVVRVRDVKVFQGIGKLLELRTFVLKDTSLDYPTSFMVRPKNGFKTLQNLHITASPGLLLDLIPSIECDTLQELKITLVVHVGHIEKEAVSKEEARIKEEARVRAEEEYAQAEKAYLTAREIRDRVRGEGVGVPPIFLGIDKVSNNPPAWTRPLPVADIPSRGSCRRPPSSVASTRRSASPVGSQTPPYRLTRSVSRSPRRSMSPVRSQTPPYRLPRSVSRSPRGRRSPHGVRTRSVSRSPVRSLPRSRTPSRSCRWTWGRSFSRSKSAHVRYPWSGDGVSGCAVVHGSGRGRAASRASSRRSHSQSPIARQIYPQLPQAQIPPSRSSRSHSRSRSPIRQQIHVPVPPPGVHMCYPPFVIQDIPLATITLPWAKTMEDILQFVPNSWPALKVLTLDLVDTTPSAGGRVFELPSRYLDSLKLLKNLESLRVENWKVVMEWQGMLHNLVPSFKKMKDFSLPLGKCSSPVDFDTLQTIAENCPVLEKLQIPISIDDTTLNTLKDSLTEMNRRDIHPLQVLSVSSTTLSPSADMAQKMTVARYIDEIFPRVESIETKAEQPEGNEFWRDIGDLVRMCQDVRTRERGRWVDAFLLKPGSGDVCDLNSK